MNDFSLRARHSTPHLLTTNTPSRSRSLLDPDDLFLHSPFRSTGDDSPGLVSPTPFASFVPSSSSQVLRTPVKQSNPLSTNAASIPSPSYRSAAGGTKRKSTTYSTPLRQHTLTPLRIQSTHQHTSNPDAIPFHCLAPLPAPRFATKTPQSKAETDSRLNKQTATMTRLKLSEDTSSHHASKDASLFLDDTNPKIMRDSSLGRKLGRHIAKSKAKALLDEDEVIEAVSPGGHVNKRRARSRPVSLELLDSIGSMKACSSAIAFPIAAASPSKSPRKSSASIGRPRVSGVTSPPILEQKPKQNPRSRAPFQRVESSATLFFGGPTIPPPANRPGLPNRYSYSGDGSLDGLRGRPPTAVAGGWDMRTRSRSPDSSPFSVVPETRDLRSLFDDDDDEEEFFTESSFSSTKGHPGAILGDKRFGDSSFVFKLTEGTPSPRDKKPAARTMLEKKYKPRDSGIAMSDDDDIFKLGTSDNAYQFLNAMPRASTSVNTISSDTDDGLALITPGVEPDAHSGWPGVRVAATHDSMDVDSDDDFGGKLSNDVDAFIIRTLNANPKPGTDPAGRKAMPGTPVKKAKKSIAAGGKPWQSEFVQKIGLHRGVEAPGPTKKGKAPRKSLPAAFPDAFKPSGAWSGDASDSDHEGAGDSPSIPGGRDGRYLGLGLGRPSADNAKMPALTRTRWLMRRSSSGAFSSNSDASLGTPTRTNMKDLTRHSTQKTMPPLTRSNATNFLLGKHASPSARSVSSSSTSSIATLNSPTTHRLQSNHATSQKHSFTPRSSSSGSRQEDKLGRFERDFIQVDEVGSGEFGKVIKVRRRNETSDGQVFALKKSKPFEGPKHRLRLREEVDILQHLSNFASARFSGVCRHSNVLEYVDSWEEDETLYIQTELCELGNFSRFLWEYGRSYPRLDEARVWKIMASLSNGIRFIHDAGVIHLDLKPANIFLTAEGRFKIGDFGMASLWPRRRPTASAAGPMEVTDGGFEREGDKLYMAPEILQGRYGKAADIFSLGMIMLETATNIVVPDQGEPWHRLRQEDFSQVDYEGSDELYSLIRSMMRTDAGRRTEAEMIWSHPVVRRAREAMEQMEGDALAQGRAVFEASPLGRVASGFLEGILG